MCLIWTDVVCALHRGMMVSLKEVGLSGFFVCAADGSKRIVLKMSSKTKMETYIFAHFPFDHWLLYCHM